MICDLKKDFKIITKKINFYSYDYVIIGTGPSASVLIDYLIKKKKKILVLEKGNFDKKNYEKIKSSNIKIGKYSRTFTVGGTSLDWSQISSYYEKFELCRSYFGSGLKKRSWPLNIKQLKYYYSKLDEKFKFNYKKIIKTKLNYYIPFTSRFFYSPLKPVNFRKFYNNKDLDLIFNCKVNFINESNKIVNLYISKNNKRVDAKKVIICAGGIESTLLILRSLNQKFLKHLKNKKYVGKFFMDHPKMNLGILKYPKINLLKEIELQTNISGLSYYGISLKKDIQLKYGLLNTYVRFEKTNGKLKSFINIFKNKKKENYYSIRCFFEMKPEIKNQIKLKNNSAIIDFNISNIEIKTLNILIKKVYEYFSNKPMLESIKKFNQKNLIIEDASHHMGGLVYPKIVDKNLKFKGLKNIFCCSSSIFPTSGSVNPTMTTCALALRLGNYLSK